MNVNNKKANRLFLAFKDMQDTLRYLRAYYELEKIDCESGRSDHADHKEAILVAAIITYCRPFKCSRSDGKAEKLIKPNEIDLFSGTQSFEGLHTVLLDLRDRAVAHCDWEYHNTELVEIEESRALRKSSRPFYMQGVSISEFTMLVEHVLVICRNMAFDLDRGGDCTIA